MSDYYCPSCGAPKHGAVCEYCGTHFGWYQGQATIEVENGYTTLYDWSGREVYRICSGQNVNVMVVNE